MSFMVSYRIVSLKVKGIIGYNIAVPGAYEPKKEEYLYKFLAVNYPMAISALFNKLCRENLDIETSGLIPIQMMAGLTISSFLELSSLIRFEGKDRFGKDVSYHAYKPPWLDIPIKLFLTLAPLVTQILADSGRFDPSLFDQDVFCDFGDCTNEQRVTRSRFYSELVYYALVMTMNFVLNHNVSNQRQWLYPSSNLNLVESRDLSALFSFRDMAKLVATTSMGVLTGYYALYKIIDLNMAFLLLDNGEPDWMSEFFKYFGVRNALVLPYSIFFMPLLVKPPSDIQWLIYEPRVNGDGYFQSARITPKKTPDLFRVIQMTNVVTAVLNYLLDYVFFIENDSSSRLNYIASLYVFLQIIFGLWFRNQDRVPMKSSRD